MSTLEEMLIQIQDYLVPVLDSYEQAIYHYIFRHTYLIGKQQMLYSTRTAEIGFGTGVNLKPPSMKTRSKKIRSLEAKGAVRIIERSNKGILVEIVLPHEISGLIEKPKRKAIDLDSLDFYKDRRLLSVLLERENYRCFYTGKMITEANCYLDHVIPQSKGGDNSYRNIVASCYDANSMKTDMNVDDFARLLFKKNLLSLDEFNALMRKIEILREGNITFKEETVLQVLS